MPNRKEKREQVQKPVKTKGTTSNTSVIMACIIICICISVLTGTKTRKRTKIRSCDTIDVSMGCGNYYEEDMKQDCIQSHPCQKKCGRMHVPIWNYEEIASCEMKTASCKRYYTIENGKTKFCTYSPVAPRCISEPEIKSSSNCPSIDYFDEECMEKQRRKYQNKM